LETVRDRDMTTTNPTMKSICFINCDYLQPQRCRMR